MAAALKFISNGLEVKVEILKFNVLDEDEKVIYNADYHQQNLQEIQNLISNLPGHRWETVRNAAIALVVSLVIASIAVGLTVGTGGIMMPVLIGGATLSAGIGFFAAKDSGIAKSINQLELSSLNFSV